MQNLRNKIYQTLRWSEGLFKTDMVYLIKSGSWLSLGHVFAMLAGFLISITFANLFPKESFGTYKFIISMVGIAGAFSLTGIGTAITQATARGFDNSLHQGFRINLKWSIGIFVGVIALSIYYYINNNSLLSFAFLIAGILYPFTLSTNLYGAYLLGKKDFRRSSLYGMIHNIAPAAAIITALFLTKSLLIIIVVYFFFGALVSFLLFRLTTNAYRYRNNKEDSELLSYGGHLSAMGIIGNIASFFDKILIFHYLGATPLAIYAFAIAPVDQLQGGKKILSALIFPKVSEKPFEELQKSLPRKALWLTAYALGLAGIYVFIAPYFYGFFFSQYLDSVFYSQIYALTLLAVSGTVFNETLIAHKKKRELYLHRTIIPIVQIILFLILLPLYGLMGLIMTHIIIKIFASLLSYYLVKYPFKSTFSS